MLLTNKRIVISALLFSFQLSTLIFTIEAYPCHNFNVNHKISLILISAVGHAHLRAPLDTLSGKSWCQIRYPRPTYLMAAIAAIRYLGTLRGKSTTVVIFSANNAMRALIAELTLFPVLSC